MHLCVHFRKPLRSAPQRFKRKPEDSTYTSVRLQGEVRRTPKIPGPTRADNLCNYGPYAPHRPCYFNSFGEESKTTVWRWHGRPVNQLGPERRAPDPASDFGTSGRSVSSFLFHTSQPYTTAKLPW